MDTLEIMRAEAEWQRAGAYSVRVQGMNRPYHISLREEFDDHDGGDARYIVLLDDGYPIATCRFYPLDAAAVSLGRVVVLPEYRGKRLGSRVVSEAERWVRELGFSEIRIDSRVSVVPFYAQLGYTFADGGAAVRSGPFECVRMHKFL